MVKKNSIIHQCYVDLTDVVAKYQDNWICDKTWLRVISLRYLNVINAIGFLRSDFDCTISSHASECGSSNEFGIFKHQFSMPCPYDSGQWRRVLFFYRQVAGKTQQLLLDHMIVRMCMLGSGQLGYQWWNERSHCLFAIQYNNNQHQPHIMTITTLMANTITATTTTTMGLTVKATSLAVTVMPSTTSAKSRYQLLLK
jgi:hypothetical protein